MYRLMIVDDEEEIRSGLCAFHWADYGFQVCVALSDGQEALDYVLTHPVDVALCDIKMEEVDGLSFATTIKERGIPLKIVILTGYKDMQYISTAMRQGCYDYLLKPTKFSKLGEVFTSLRRELDASWSKKLSMQVEHDRYGGGDVIQYAKAYIRAHIETASLDSLASYLSLSSVYVSRLFKEKTGQSFSDFYQACRFEKAKELLSDPGLSVILVAKCVGYTNATNFARAFKLACGESPTEYRSHLKLRNDLPG